MGNMTIVGLLNEINTIDYDELQELLWEKNTE